MEYEAIDILAATRSRSRKNNTQLFFNTLAPLRYYCERRQSDKVSKKNFEEDLDFFTPKS